MHNTSVDTTVSNAPSRNGSASARAATTVASRPDRATRRASRAHIAESGSVNTSSPIPAG